MLCENCHHNEATEVVMKADGLGGEIESFVCKACADQIRRANAQSAEDQEEKSLTAENLADGMPHVFTAGDAENAPPFVKSLLEATMGFIKGIAEENKANAKCPVCGCTLSKIMEDDLVGCPECWKTFGDELRHHYLNEQYGSHHLGPTPATSEREFTRATLERRLKNAIDKQDFRKAAEIKAAIDALDTKGKDSK